MDKTQPLALPQGSVRAIMALLFTGAGTLLFATGAAIRPEFLVILTAVITFYFGTRAGAPNPEPSVPAPIGGIGE